MPQRQPPPTWTPLEEGIVAPYQLLQRHFGSFVDLLEGLAKNHGKSGADRERSTKDLLAKSGGSKLKQEGVTAETRADVLGHVGSNVTEEV